MLYLPTTGLLALVRMPQAAPSTRTFFVSSTTAGRRALLQSDRMVQVLVDFLAENRQKRGFLLHDFVIMPNHFHLLLTPAADISLWKKHFNSSRAVSPMARKGKFILLLKYGNRVS
jgi:REP element-mobilizing transposase RayT